MPRRKNWPQHILHRACLVLIGVHSSSIVVEISSFWQVTISIVDESRLCFYAEKTVRSFSSKLVLALSKIILSCGNHVATNAQTIKDGGLWRLSDQEFYSRRFAAAGFTTLFSLRPRRDDADATAAIRSALRHRVWRHGHGLSGV